MSVLRAPPPKKKRLAKIRPYVALICLWLFPWKPLNAVICALHAAICLLFVPYLFLICFLINATICLLFVPYVFLDVFLIAHV